MSWIPKPTGFISIKIPFQGPGGYNATKEEALEKAQELENEGKKKAEEKIFGEKR